MVDTHLMAAGVELDPFSVLSEQRNLEHVLPAGVLVSTYYVYGSHNSSSNLAPLFSF